MGALGATLQLMRERAFKPRANAPYLMKDTPNEGLHKVLGAWDLTFLGIGGIIGAGVFVLTGVAAKEEAGPAVVLSYVVASVVALLSAFCYTEFACDLPYAGGAYVYINLTFGELAAWVAASNLLLEYTLGGAAVARSFTSYLGAMLAGDPNHFRVHLGSPYFLMDMPACALTAATCLLLARGTQHGARFNTVVTVSNVLVILFVLVTGAMHFKEDNFRVFLPFGAHGVLAGASKVFFSFIGFDAVTTAAEETRNPSVDLPIGIISALGVCATLYALMCIIICGMVPWDSIDVDAPFAAAYDAVGMAWAGKVVAVGALMGIVTSLLVNLFGQMRLWMTLGREHFVPPVCAAIHERFHTPLNSAMISATTAGVFALFVDLEALADLVSIGTLTVFLMVSFACLWRRYMTRPAGSGGGLPAAATPLFTLLAAAVGTATAFVAAAPLWVTLGFAGLWLASTIVLSLLPTYWSPTKFAVPLSPFFPSLSVVANLFLICSLGIPAYVRFAVWFLVALVVYVTYGLHQGGPAGGPPQDELGLADRGAGSLEEREAPTPPGSVRARTSPRRAEASAGGAAAAATLAPLDPGGQSFASLGSLGASGGQNGADPLEYVDEA